MKFSPLSLISLTSAASEQTCTGNADSNKGLNKNFFQVEYGALRRLLQSVSQVDYNHRGKDELSPTAPLAEGAGNAIDASIGKAVSLLGQPESQPDIRPSLQDGKADQVEFGILVKKWYGIDFVKGTATVDAVIILNWLDPRASQLVPFNASALRLSRDSAAKQMWLPDITATNFAHHGSDTISSSILVAKNGSINKVDRTLLTLEQSYNTERFPFDTQDVSIRVASTTYMRSELQLVPAEDNSLWGAPSELFSNSIWSVVTASLTEISEDDGMLTKSRGVLTLKVRRDPTQYTSSIFIPTVLLLFMTWTALWFPLAAPYVMPRVAVNAIALLSMVGVSQKADNVIPATGKNTWMGEYLEVCIELQFALLLCNALILSAEHRKGADAKSSANALDVELIIAIPILAAIAILCVFIGLLIASRCLIVAFVLGFCGYVFRHWRLAHT